MTSAASKPGFAPAARAPRVLSLGVAAALCTLVAGCGIGESVADPCITVQRVYERAQKRVTSLQSAGVPREATVRRAAIDRLAEARADYTACVASRADEAI